MYICISNASATFNRKLHDFHLHKVCMHLIASASLLVDLVRVLHLPPISKPEQRATQRYGRRDQLFTSKCLGTRVDRNRNPVLIASIQYSRMWQ